MNKTHTTTQQIVASGFDGHVWIEDEHGEVIDYPDDLLEMSSQYGTRDIVRKEFPVKVQCELLPRVIAAYKSKLHQPPIMQQMMRETPGFCQSKSMQYKVKHPKAKIKIGSLGFRQANGDIFWEYG
jgi:hypothetical protein